MGFWDSVVNAASSVASGISDAAKDVEAGVEHGAADLFKGKLEAAAHDVGGGLKSAYNSATDGVAGAVGDVAGEKAKTVFREGAQALEKSAEANAKLSLGVAEGVGEGAVGMVTGTAHLIGGAYKYATDSGYRHDVNSTVEHGAQYVWDHPGEALEKAGSAVKNLAVNTYDGAAKAVETGDYESIGKGVGEVGFAVATTVVAPEALIGKAGEAAEVVGALGRGGELVGDAGKLGRTGEAVADAGKVGEAVADAGKAGEAVADAGKAGEAVADAGKVGEAVADAGNSGKAVADGAGAVDSASASRAFDVTKVTVKDIPTFKSGDFNAWFDARTPEEVATMYKSPALRAKIEAGLRGGGNNHEFLMVAEAPQWKQWGASAKMVQEDFAVPISKLNDEGLAKGWTHSTGLEGSKATGSKMVHNQLQAIIQKSNSLAEFKQNIRPWAEKWITGGYDALPRGFHN